MEPYPEFRILPEYFKAMEDGRMRCDLRAEYEDAKEGDIFIYREWYPESDFRNADKDSPELIDEERMGMYTGRKLKMQVTYVRYEFDGWALPAISVTKDTLTADLRPIKAVSLKLVDGD